MQGLQLEEDALTRYRKQTQLNKKNDGKRLSLVERQSEYGSKGNSAFKQSEQRIKFTQQMTDSLKARRIKVEETIERDSTELRKTDKAIAEYTKKLNTIKVRKEKRMKEREILQTALKDGKQKSNELMQECGHWLSRNSMHDRIRNRKCASDVLKQERGFSCDPTTTCSAAEAKKRSSSRM